MPFMMALMPNPRTAIFLDRDGTINVEVNHLSSPAQISLIPGAGKAIRAINRSGALAVVVTNQPVLARGDVDWRGMETIHAQFDKLLGEEGAYIDRLYLCPHHPDAGFEGEVLSLKKICECRKPAIGLIEQAVADLGIAIERSWMVGDSTADILAGNNIGLQTILVGTGNAGRDKKYTCKPDFVVDDISSAVSWILGGREEIARQMLPIIDEIGAPRLIILGGKREAGTTIVAKVMAQLYKQVGRNAHVVSLERWVSERAGGDGGTNVRKEFDQNGFYADVLHKLSSKHDFLIFAQAFASGDSKQVESEQLQIAATDVIIVEGSCAYIDELMLDKAKAVVFIDFQKNNNKSHQSKTKNITYGDDIVAVSVSNISNDEEIEIKFKKAVANYIVTSEYFL